MKLWPEGFNAIASNVPVDLERVRRPQYGRFLEDFMPGRVVRHPRGITLDRGFMLDYATTFMEANPLHLNEAFARLHGFDSLPATPHLLLNLTLSLGVQNNSEQAIANLGYYDVRFLRPAYAGDTLTAMTRVADRRIRGNDKPGIVTLESLALNQRHEVVVQYARKILVPRRTNAELASESRVQSSLDFPYAVSPTTTLPMGYAAPAAAELTGDGSRLDTFCPGEIIVHPHGRTITDEHLSWSSRLMNTHPLHYDRLYSNAREGKMSGEPIVYGGLVLAWLLGLTSREVSENALWDVGYHDGYHTQPTFAGETIGALSRVLQVVPVSATWGIMTVQLIGVKQITAGDALDRYGEALFRREKDKKAAGEAKIAEKIFEMERSLLVRR